MNLFWKCFFFLLEYSTWLWSWAGTLYFQKLLEFSSGWLVVVSAIPRKGTLAGERRINSFSGGLRGTFLTSSFRRLHMINGLIHCITFEIPKACVDSLLLLFFPTIFCPDFFPFHFPFAFGFPSSLVSFCFEQFTHNVLIVLIIIILVLQNSKNNSFHLKINNVWLFFGLMVYK